MSDLRLVERNVHRVDVDGRRMLFHIPTSGLFELDSLSDEMIDLFAPVAAADGSRTDSVVTADDVRRRFDGRHPPDAVVETIKELCRTRFLADTSLSPRRK